MRETDTPKNCGAIHPKNEGPSIIPANISPTTRGCWNFLKSDPVKRQAASTTETCKTRMKRLGISACLRDFSAALRRESPDGAHEAQPCTRSFRSYVLGSVSGSRVA